MNLKVQNGTLFNNILLKSEKEMQFFVIASNITFSISIMMKFTECYIFFENHHFFSSICHFFKQAIKVSLKSQKSAIFIQNQTLLLVGDKMLQQL